MFALELNIVFFSYKSKDMKQLLTTLLFLLTLHVYSQQKVETMQMDSLISLWHTERAEELKGEWENQAMVYGGNTMKFWHKYYGDAPRGTRSMWISMHGGGNAPAELNNQQWENQKLLYKPSEGLYVAPRAPWNDWDMWFKPGMDELLHRLITAAVLFEGVDPNKVYLMGYSAGGDGVWRMGPRMADSWAAASMMAGHPGDVSLLSLRNTPFMMWVGELDAAYERNKKVPEWGKKLDQLQSEDSEGYVHETRVVKGKPHWMNLEDAAAVPWMAKFTRNPLPQRVVWQQGDVMHNYFYWLGVNKDEAKKGNLLIAERNGNTIEIIHSDYSSVTIYLNERMFNLDKTIVVKYKSKMIFREKVKKNVELMKTTLYERDDPNYMFCSKLKLNL
jgi:hypothetical protein